MPHFGKKKINRKVNKTFSLSFPFCVCLKDRQTRLTVIQTSHLTQSRGGCSFVEAQNFDWLPTLISTESPCTRPHPSNFHHALETTKSSPTASVWTDSGSTHEELYMSSLVNWPWTGLVFVWRAQGCPPLLCC